MIYYFAYGSNMDQGQMEERCPDARLVGEAVLKGYALGFTIYSKKRDCGCADIIKNKDSKVYGLLYVLSEEDLKRLDSFEGVPKHYRRIDVEVLKESGDAIAVVSYEVAEKQEFIAPSAEYIGIIKKAARDFVFSKEYQEMLDGVKIKE